MAQRQGQTATIKLILNTGDHYRKREGEIRAGWPSLAHKIREREACFYTPGARSRPFLLDRRGWWNLFVR